MKRSLKIIVYGIIFGLLLLAIQLGFKIPQKQFMKYYIIAAPFIILAAMLINIIYFLFYRKKLMKIVALVDDKKDYTEAIDQLAALKQKAKGNYLNHMIDMLRAEFYNENGQSSLSIEILEKMKRQKINKEQLKVYSLILSNAYFRNGNGEKAIEIYNQYQEEFKQFEKTKNFQKDLNYLYLTHTYADFYKRDFEMAKIHLEQLIDSDKNHKYEQEIKAFQQQLAKQSVAE